MLKGISNHQAADRCEQRQTDGRGNLAKHLSSARAQLIADDLHRDFRAGECEPQPQPRVERELHNADSNRHRQHVESSVSATPRTLAIRTTPWGTANRTSE